MCTTERTSVQGPLSTVLLRWKDSPRMFCLLFAACRLCLMSCPKWRDAATTLSLSGCSKMSYLTQTPSRMSCRGGGTGGKTVLPVISTYLTLFSALSKLLTLRLFPTFQLSLGSWLSCPSPARRVASHRERWNLSCTLCSKLGLASCPQTSCLIGCHTLLKLQNVPLYSLNCRSHLTVGFSMFILLVELDLYTLSIIT